jgi:hypothetical protein
MALKRHYTLQFFGWAKPYPHLKLRDRFTIRQPGSTPVTSSGLRGGIAA